jgi:hypothetical protein
MKNSLIQKLNDDFIKGICPDSLTYTIEPRSNIDFYKLWYGNDYYKSIDFISKSLPIGWDNIPGFDLVLEDMANNALTPLEEIELRQQKINNLDNNIDSNGINPIVSQQQ